MEPADDILLDDDAALELPSEPMRLNMGPSHPAMHGTIRMVLDLDGEIVQNVDVQPGYLHRGFEKSCERGTWAQVFPYTDRLNYVSPMCNNVGYALAVEKLGAAGYRYVGMDHFALPEDELCQALDSGSLHRNFMGYTTHADCELLGLGVSAISQIGDSFSQNHRDLGVYQEQIDEGRLPLWRGLKLSDDDLLRAAVIQDLMCRGEIDVASVESRFDIDFSAYFAGALAALQPLADDGLVEVDARHIRATARGRLLLRVIAACFDVYLGLSQEQPRYSKAV